MDAIFKTDIRKLLENNTNKDLVHKLIDHAKDFRNIYDSNQKEKYKSNLACNAVYNKITAYKYSLNQIITDLFVLSHFNHFYIPHMVTGTGRILPKVNLVQLQGLKIIKPNIWFQDVAFFSQTQLNDLNSILKELHPDIPEKLLFNDPKVLHSYLRNLYNKYTMSFCNQGTNFNSFPENESLHDQYEWLCKHVSKKEYILYVRTLILCHNDFLRMFYFKDATSSGLQLISIVKRDPILAKRTGLLLTSTKDIHTEVLENFLSLREKIYNSIEPILNKVLNITTEKSKKLRSVKQKIKRLITLPLYRKDYFENSTEFTITKRENKKITAKNIQRIEWDDVNVSKDTRLFVKEFNEIADLIEENVKLKEELESFKLQSIDGITTGQIYPNCITSPIQKVLYTLRKVYNMYQLLELVPKEFFNRKFFKNLGMPRSYGEGPKRRIEGIVEKLIEYYTKEGYANSLLSRESLAEIAIMINNLFQKASDEIYESVDRYIDNIHRYVDDLLEGLSDEVAWSPIEVKMEYYTWNCYIEKKNSSRHEINLKDNEKINFTVYHNFSIHIDETKVKMPAIVIQAVEAHIVYKLVEYVSVLNKRFKEKGLPEISSTINNANLISKTTH